MGLCLGCLRENEAQLRGLPSESNKSYQNYVMTIENEDTGEKITWAPSEEKEQDGWVTSLTEINLP